MSDIAQNALRYTDKNTKRSDAPYTHTGERVDPTNDSNPVLRFDCSGFVCHVIIESGYRIDYAGTSSLLTSNAFTTIDSYSQVQPGDIILFDGHVGIVFEYDHAKSNGRFIHMSGSKNKGGIKKSYFITDANNYMKIFKKEPSDNGYLKAPDGSSIEYGPHKRKIKAFLRINKDRYSAAVDLHSNSFFNYSHIPGTNQNPILRPLGTRVYSKYISSIDKASKTAKNKPAQRKRPRGIPIQKQRNIVSAPHRDDNNIFDRIYSKLPKMLNRIYSKLPEF